MSKWEKHDMSTEQVSLLETFRAKISRQRRSENSQKLALSMLTRMRGQKIGESSHQHESLRSSPRLTSWLEWSRQRSLAQARTFRTPYLEAGTRL